MPSILESAKKLITRKAVELEYRDGFDRAADVALLRDEPARRARADEVGAAFLAAQAAAEQRESSINRGIMEPAATSETPPEARRRHEHALRILQESVDAAGRLWGRPHLVEVRDEQAEIARKRAALARVIAPADENVTDAFNSLHHHDELLEVAIRNAEEFPDNEILRRELDATQRRHDEAARVLEEATAARDDLRSQYDALVERIRQLRGDYLADLVANYGVG